MDKLLIRMTVIILMMGSVGCASLVSVSLTPIPAQRDHQVQVEKSKVIVLGFNFDNDFVDQMVTDLKQQCPNGKVTGILTKDEAIDYFLFFVWKRRVTATGYCLKSVASAGDIRSGSKARVE